MSDPRNQTVAARPGLFAPYPVWATVRVVTTIGTTMLIVWIGWAIVCLFKGAAGRDFTLLPGWIGIVGMIIGAGNRGFPRDLPPFGEAVGRLFASKVCPACGQSIFDHTPSMGYAADVERHRVWPSRFCTNCGHDMKVRTAR